MSFATDRAGRADTPPPRRSGGGVHLGIGLLIFAGLGLILESSYIFHVLILCFLWSIVVAGWDLVLGYAGIFNFAQLVFFAVGAYASGMLSISMGFHPIVALLIAAVVAGLFGLLIGLPCLRLRGEYVALFTFAVHLALPPLIIQGRALGTGGSTGLIGVPPLQAFGLTMHTVDKQAWYFLTLAAAALVLYAVYFRVLRGKLGKAFVAMRDAEDFARALGVNEYKHKLIAFILSATITGFAGALYAHYIGVVTPKILGNEFFLMVMLMLSVGGLGRFPGAILGAFAITIGNELLRDTGQYRLLLLGTCVVLVILLVPEGLPQLRERGARLFGRK
ncbi:MAG TPA: branched-chain amino acid ABC transporter permease [Alphaproteobacteria bacterium]|nr:branched-chain amino acid ABC transporter permease [Alphaproteobacteria bacterium]